MSLRVVEKLVEDAEDVEDTDFSRCSHKRCHERSEVIWLGEPLCDDHWLEICKADAKREAAELQELINEDPVFYSGLIAEER